MGETKNLMDEKAVKKLKSLTEDKVCMLCTYEKEFSIQARPMSTAKVDEDGNLWFLSNKGSGQNEQIADHSMVDVLYANSDQSYCTVKGRASVHTDRNLINDLWTPLAKNWFEGKDDPTISVIQVSPREAHYWDTKSNKYISFIKMAAGAVTGKNMDDGVQGDLNV